MSFDGVSVVRLYSIALFLCTQSMLHVGGECPLSRMEPDCALGEMNPERNEGLHPAYPGADHLTVAIYVTVRMVNADQDSSPDCAVLTIGSVYEYETDCYEVLFAMAHSIREVQTRPLMWALLYAECRIRSELQFER